jgi:5-formyltetrahydrofolate cyclo-ligase
MRAVRAALPASACETRSAQVVTRVLALEELQKAETILAFASIRNEVRTHALIDALHTQGKRVLLPRVADRGLTLHLATQGAELPSGAFSVPEPPSGAPRVSADEVDFALIPALAVDPRGYRIGYGGGYYDRLVPQLRNAITCALVYDFQLVAEVPELPFDEAVDLIVTDAQVIRPVV